VIYFLLFVPPDIKSILGAHNSNFRCGTASFNVSAFVILYDHEFGNMCLSEFCSCL